MSDDKSIEELEKIADWAIKELDKPPERNIPKYDARS